MIPERMAYLSFKGSPRFEWAHGWNFEVFFSSQALPIIFHPFDRLYPYYYYEAGRDS
jgi:hypothetical protein